VVLAEDHRAETQSAASRHRMSSPACVFSSASRGTRCFSVVGVVLQSRQGQSCTGAPVPPSVAVSERGSFFNQVSRVPCVRGFATNAPHGRLVFFGGFFFTAVFARFAARSAAIVMSVLPYGFIVCRCAKLSGLYLRLVPQSHSTFGGCSRFGVIVSVHLPVNLLSPSPCRCAKRNTKKICVPCSEVRGNSSVHLGTKNAGVATMTTRLSLSR